MTPAALSCQGVTIRHGETLILDVEALDVAAGETLAILGPNGAGKSSLLGVLGLTRSPTTGVVRLGDEEASTAAVRRRLRRRIVTQLQESILLEGSVAWNIALPSRLRRLPAAATSTRTEAWASAFGVQGLLGRDVSSLSGGEARRTCLARAFAAEPDALLIDEPLAGIDAAFRDEILHRLSVALAEHRWTTVLVTHDLVEAIRLADRLAILVGGRIRQIGRPADVLAAPSDPDVARLVGTDTYVHGIGEHDAAVNRIRVGEVRIVVGQEVASGEELWVAIRPEDVTLFVGAEPPGRGALNCLPAAVTAVHPRGSTAHVALDAGFPLGALVLAGTVEALGLQPGRRVWASLKATAVRRV